MTEDDFTKRCRRRAILLEHELGWTHEQAATVADAVGDILGGLEIVDGIIAWRRRRFTDDEIVEWCGHGMVADYEAELYRGFGFSAQQARAIANAQSGDHVDLTDQQWDDLLESDYPRDLVALALTARPGTKKVLDEWLANDTPEGRESLRLMIALEV